MYSSIIFNNQSSFGQILSGWSSLRSSELSGDDTGAYVGVRIFSFSVGFLSYLTIYIIVAVPSVSVYLEKVISYIRIEFHLLSFRKTYSSEVGYFKQSLYSFQNIHKSNNR